MKPCDCHRRASLLLFRPLWKAQLALRASLSGRMGGRLSVSGFLSAAPASLESPTCTSCIPVRANGRPPFGVRFLIRRSGLLGKPNLHFVHPYPGEWAFQGGRAGGCPISPATWALPNNVMIMREIAHLLVLLESNEVKGGTCWQLNRKPTA